MQKKFRPAFVLLSCLGMVLCSFSYAQTAAPANDSSRKVIQFSGLIVDADSLLPVPYAAIVVRNSERGVYSNLNGYYSMVVQEKDTIEFYALGYSRASFIVPDTFTTSLYTHVQTLKPDTILLNEAVIYPWPSKEQFKAAFLSADIPHDDLDRARRNLARADMVQAAQSVAMDGGMVYRASAQQQAQRSATYGQYPSTNLLNPVAWAKFLQALNNGELKRQ